MIAQAILPEILPETLSELLPETLLEPEPCPVCFNDDLSSLKRLNGCGHSVCGDCKTGLYAAQNQFKTSTQILKKEKKKIIMKLLKCPICRTVEKPTCGLARENAEIQIGKNVSLIQLCNMQNPLKHCQNAGCTRQCRTRDRCPNHPEVPCCLRHTGCDRCINP